MTDRTDVARGRDVVARWCALAEQRLEYLTELFETGRWRRYHSELAFLENIREARTALETWRDLSMREASRDNSALDISWLGRAGATPPRGERLREQLHRPLPQLAEIAAELPPSDVSIVPKSADLGSAPSIGDTPKLMPVMRPIAERYPLLRNTL